MLAVAAIIGAVTLHAATEGGGPMHFHLQAMMTMLGLTDQQKEQLRLILKENQPTVQPLIKQFVDERRALRGLVETTPVNEQAIRDEVAKMAATGADLAVKHAYIAQRVRTVLTPDQVQKIMDLQSHHDEHMDGMIDKIGQIIAQ